MWGVVLAVVPGVQRDIAPSLCLRGRHPASVLALGASLRALHGAVCLFSGVRLESPGGWRRPRGPVFPSHGPGAWPCNVGVLTTHWGHDPNTPSLDTWNHDWEVLVLVGMPALHLVALCPACSLWPCHCLLLLRGASSVGVGPAVPRLPTASCGSTCVLACVTLLS